MRRVIAIALSLLCIALPLRADATAGDRHCPRMQTHLSTDAQQHDCCNDAATYASTGQLCKMGQQCSPPMTFPIPASVVQVAFAASHAVAPTPSRLLYLRPPATVWRPPNLS